MLITKPTGGFNVSSSELLNYTIYKFIIDNSRLIEKMSAEQVNIRGEGINAKKLKKATLAYTYCIGWKVD